MYRTHLYWEITRGGSDFENRCRRGPRIKANFLGDGIENRGNFKLFHGNDVSLLRNFLLQRPIYIGLKVFACGALKYTDLI